MKEKAKKVAIRPIRRTTPQESPALAAAARPVHAYPDASSFAATIRAAAERAIRIAAVPTAGLLAGCGSGSGDVVPSLSQFRFGWEGRIGTVVEGLRPPEEPYPIAGEMPAVQVFPVPAIPEAVPPPAVPDPDPIPVRGLVAPARPPPPPPPQRESVRIVGDMAAVRPSSPSSMRLAAGWNAPRTLSDESLAAALASIR